MDQLLQLDYRLFEWINHGWQHPWLDIIMPYWREKTTWIPAYLLMVGILVWKYRLKTLYFVIALGITVGVADQVSSELIKKNVERLRPCRESKLEPAARTLIHCGGGYSFTSSHATNHFAVAVFLFFSWGLRWKKWRWLLLLWAASIALGQVYVGVHYPLDITVGAIIGSLLGYTGSLCYKRWRKWRIDDFYSAKVPIV